MAKAIWEAAVGALSILLLSLASSCVTLLCASATATALAGPPPLPRLVHLDTKAPVTVSGVSSGGAFAMQLHLAYSRGIVGAGLVAAPPYWCAQDSLQIALTACEKDASLISISVLEAEARFAQDTAGSIDRLSNLRGSRVWLLSGTRDTVVRQAVVNKTHELYARWVPPESIEYVASLASEHAWITDDYGSACSRLGSPFINNCKFDASGAMLRHLLGADAVNKSRVKRVPENFYRFDQSIYTPLHTPDLSSMSPSGYAYIPLVCRLNSSSSSSSSSTARSPSSFASYSPPSSPPPSSCKGVHVVHHGCKQTLDDIGEAFVQNSGLAEYAEANGLALLFPQARRSSTLPYNPQGCWDFWGYTGPDYATRLGVQMKAVGNMLHQLTGRPVFLA